MAFPGWSRLRSIYTGSSRHPRLFIDASSFDPSCPQKKERAVLLLIQDVEDIVFDCVRNELQEAAGVVALDMGSNDASPYLAAEAGALVLLWKKGMGKEDAFGQALAAAKMFSNTVEVIALSKAVQCARALRENAFCSD